MFGKSTMPLETGADTPDPTTPDLISDCRLMLRYARRNALAIPSNLRREVAQLDGLLIALGLAPVSDLPRKLVAQALPTNLQQTPTDGAVTATVPSLADPTKPSASSVVPPTVASATDSSAASQQVAANPATPTELNSETTSVLPGAAKDTGSSNAPVSAAVSGQPFDSPGTATPGQAAPASADSPVQQLVKPPEPTGREPQSTTELVLNVHEELSNIISPATALSLQTSEPPPGRHRFLGGMPLIVKWAAILALVSALCFVVTGLIAGHVQHSNPSGPPSHNSGTMTEGEAMKWIDTVLSSENFWIALNATTAAVLGAGFYVLLRTQPYLVNRSYDPKYNAAYISRFITGVIAGVILAMALKDQILSAAKAGSSTTVTAITPGILGLLGGYAAEAVEQILQRLVDVLLAAVRGDSSAQAQANATADQAAKNVKLQQVAAEALADAGNDPKVRDALQKIQNALRTTMK